MVHHRTVPVVVAVLVVALLSGCVGGAPRAATFSEVDVESVRAAGDTLYVTERVDAENVTYYESNETVRYVEGRIHADRSAVVNGTEPDRVPVYGFVPYAEWVRVECFSTTAGALNAILERRLAGNETRDGVAVWVSADAVTVRRVTRLDRSGDVYSSPNVTAERLEAVTPDSGIVTVRFAGRADRCTVPIRVRNTTTQLV